MAAKKKAPSTGRAAGKAADTAAGRAGGARSRAGNVLYSANQIWLAGLGALGRAQGGSGGAQGFESLMKEGAKLQSAALDTAQKAVMTAFKGAQHVVDQKVGGVRNQAQDTWDNLEKIFQARVQRALHQIGMPTAEEMAALARRVEQLNKSVDGLAQATRAAGRKPARKAPRRAKPAAGHDGG